MSLDLINVAFVTVMKVAMQSPATLVKEVFACNYFTSSVKTGVGILIMGLMKDFFFEGLG